MDGAAWTRALSDYLPRAVPGCAGADTPGGAIRTRARERNAGWRIDYFIVSERLLPKVRTA